MNTTVRIKASEIYKDWHVIDAAGRPLGRVATEAAILLRGKHKPTYEPHLDDGDFVIVINASQVRVTGNKADQIKYYSHSGYPGGLKTRSYADQLSRFPERVLEKAIWGMLPGGPLGEKMFKHLKVYKGAHHPHQSQITGSKKAQETRAEAQKALADAPRKAPRLRPLSVPVLDEPVAIEEAALAPVAAPPAKAPRAKAPSKAEVATAEPELETSADEAESTPSEAVDVTPAAAVAEAPAEEAAAETTEPKKPARRRSAPKTEE